MADLMHGQFADFFQSVHRHEPFDWQMRLAKEVLQEGGWHDVIRVPTACGKTSVLDLAVFELAVQADLQPNRRTAARRICFVVDRRLVVDEVTEHARRIHDAIQSAANGKRDEPVLAAIAKRLAKLAADPSDPLLVTRLRGGVYRDDAWAADPLTPTILVSTVDQIGSRLLFRGYGVSSRSRPAHAGLLAFDTRIILDEAHLSTVFTKTLERIRHYQSWAECSPLPPERRVSIVHMSATAGEGERLFELTEKERKDIRLKPRLDAHKRANLVEVKVESITKDTLKKQPRKACEQEKQNREELVGKSVSQAERLAWFDGDAVSDLPRVIGVVVNRVATARQIFERLRGTNTTQPERGAVLLTGRIRPYDRDRLLHEWLPRIRAGRETEPDRPLFVVATQTVEVGANLDFDALVTEAAPLDALRQRFGRLDRLGKRHERNAPSAATVIIRTDQKSGTYHDLVYGSAVAATWKWLTGKNVRDKSKRVDFGVNQLDPKLKKVQDLADMLAPKPKDPLLLPAHLYAWAQTNPEPEPDPDVEPFLHGAAEAAADVQVVWRADLDDESETSWRDVVTLMPPRTREALPVPIYEVRRWLRNDATADIADVEGAVTEGQPTHQGRTRRALRWRGPGDHQTKPIGPDDVRPGDTIIVPASYGGADDFGWKPSSDAPVPDVAEDCLVQLIASYPDNAFRRPKLRLRLHPLLLPQSGEAAPNRLRTLLNAAVAAARSEQQDPWLAVRHLLQAMKEHLSEPTRRAAVDVFLQAKRPPQIRLYPRPLHHGLLLVAPLPVSLPAELVAPPEEFETEEPVDDEASVAAEGRPISLSEHTQAVEQISVEFAQQCGLGEQLTAVLRLAARWHDQGKRDPRFQAWLHGSELKALSALAADHPLAKSGRDPKHWKPSDAFGYPRGLRHEFVSIRLFEQASHAEVVDSALVKLLIGTHHGYGRAFAPTVDDPRPINVTLVHDGQRLVVCSDHRLYRVDSAWTDLFWRVVRRYGWWGLAYLEAILVTADRIVSAHEQQRQNRSEANWHERP